jgi:hypothetical protein
MASTEFFGTLYHVTTEKKARRARDAGGIPGPVRGFTTLQAAMFWAMKVGRTVIYAVRHADSSKYHKLPDHHNRFGDAWWIDADVTEFECVVSAGGRRTWHTEHRRGPGSDP